MAQYIKSKEVYIDSDGEFRLRTISSDYRQNVIKVKSALDNSVSDVKEYLYRVKSVVSSDLESEYIALYNVYDIPVKLDSLNQYRLKSVGSKGASDWLSTLFFIDENGLIPHDNNPFIQFINDVLDIYIEDYLTEIILTNVLTDCITIGSILDEIDYLIDKHLREFVNLYIDANNIKVSSGINKYCKDIIESDFIIDRAAEVLSQIIENKGLLQLNFKESLSMLIEPLLKQDTFQINYKDLLSKIIYSSDLNLNINKTISDNIDLVATKNSNFDTALIGFIDNIIIDTVKDIFVQFIKKDNFITFTEEIISIMYIPSFDDKLSKEYVDNTQQVLNIEYKNSEYLSQDIIYDINFNDFIQKYKNITTVKMSFYKANISDQASLILDKYVDDLIMSYYLDNISPYGDFIIDQSYYNDFSTAINAIAYKNDNLEGFLSDVWNHRFSDALKRQVDYGVLNFKNINAADIIVYAIMVHMYGYFPIKIADNVGTYINNEQGIETVLDVLFINYDDKMLPVSSIQNNVLTKHNFKNNDQTFIIHKLAPIVDTLDSFIIDDSMDYFKAVIYDIMGQALMGMVPMGYDGTQELTPEQESEMGLV